MLLLDRSRSGLGRSDSVSEPPDKPSGSRHYLPPPPDDSSESVDRAAHGAAAGFASRPWVRSRPGSQLPTERGASWVWVLLLILSHVAIATTLGSATELKAR